MPVMRLGTRLLSLGLALAGVAALARPVEAQGRRTVLTISGFPYVSTVTQTDFANGFVNLGTTTFTVDLTTNSGAGFDSRRTTVQVSCGTPCPTSGTLVTANLQWRRSDLGTWNSITTAFVTIEERVATFNGTNDPWSNTIVWRYVLDYATDPPQTGSQFQVRFQLVTAAP